MVLLDVCMVNSRDIYNLSRYIVAVRVTPLLPKLTQQNTVQICRTNYPLAALAPPELVLRDNVRAPLVSPSLPRYLSPLTSSPQRVLRACLTTVRPDTTSFYTSATLTPNSFREDTHNCLIDPIISATTVSAPIKPDCCPTAARLWPDSPACLPLSASNSYLFCPVSRQTLILKPPALPVSLQEATRDIWNDVVFILSKNALDSDGMI